MSIPVYFKIDGCAYKVKLLKEELLQRYWYILKNSGIALLVSTRQGTSIQESHTDAHDNISTLGASLIAATKATTIYVTWCPQNKIQVYPKCFGSLKPLIDTHNLGNHLDNTSASHAGNYCNWSCCQIVQPWHLRLYLSAWFQRSQNYKPTRLSSWKSNLQSSEPFHQWAGKELLSSHRTAQLSASGWTQWYCTETNSPQLSISRQLMET